MDEETLKFRDFVIKQLPRLSLEGDERKIFIKVKDFKIIEVSCRDI